MRLRQSFRNLITVRTAKVMQVEMHKNKTTTTTVTAAQRFPRIGKKRMKTIKAKRRIQQDLNLIFDEIVLESNEIYLGELRNVHNFKE